MQGQEYYGHVIKPGVDHTNVESSMKSYDQLWNKFKKFHREVRYKGQEVDFGTGKGN